MSWNMNGTATVRRKSSTGGIGVELNFQNPCPQHGHGAVESEQAMAIAQRVAGVLLESGAFGTGDFSVMINGHSNPDNKPSPGWCNDNVQISIVQR
jgi:hypothetical protein